MTTKELNEQIQNDLICLLEDIIDQDTLAQACQIIVDNINRFDKNPS